MWRWFWKHSSFIHVRNLCTDESDCWWPLFPSNILFFCWRLITWRWEKGETVRYVLTAIFLIKYLIEVERGGLYSAKKSSSIANNAAVRVIYNFYSFSIAHQLPPVRCVRFLSGCWYHAYAQQHRAECIRQDSHDEGHRVIPRNRDVILVECKPNGRFRDE